MRRMLLLLGAALLVVIVLPGGLAATVSADDGDALTPIASPSPSMLPTEATSTPTPEPPVVNSALPLAKGAQGWRVRDVQERLQWLGYDIAAKELRAGRLWPTTMAAVRAFQTKNWLRPTGVVGPVTWQRLRRVSAPLGQLPASCTEVDSLCLDKSQRLLRYVVNGEVIRTLDARFGFVGNETLEGTYRIYLKDRDHTSTLYRTWMPYAMFFNAGAAVHYSPYFARDGYNGGSHGCVNLRDIDQARWLFEHVPIGTRVHIYRS